MRWFRLSALARSDLADIRHESRQDRMVIGFERRIGEFFQRFHTLATDPDLGQRRPKFGAEVRVFSAGTYVIVYRPFSGGIEVVRVVSGFRDLDALLGSP
jgi:toxin ParE1/3/4